MALSLRIGDAWFDLDTFGERLFVVFTLSGVLTLLGLREWVCSGMSAAFDCIAAFIAEAMDIAQAALAPLVDDNFSRLA